MHDRYQNDFVERKVPEEEAALDTGFFEEFSNRRAERVGSE